MPQRLVFGFHHSPSLISFPELEVRPQTSNYKWAYPAKGQEDETINQLARSQTVRDSTNRYAGKAAHVSQCLASLFCPSLP